jgi:hypothetical protein
MDILHYLLILIIIIFLYVILNLLKKIELAEIQINEYIDIEENSYQLLNSLIIKYTNVLNELKRIDRLGSFESDDEVGFVFKTIKNTINDLVEKLNDMKTKINND